MGQKGIKLFKVFVELFALEPVQKSLSWTSEPDHLGLILVLSLNSYVTLASYLAFLCLNFFKMGIIIVLHRVVMQIKLIICKVFRGLPDMYI